LKNYKNRQGGLQTPP